MFKHLLILLLTFTQVFSKRVIELNPTNLISIRGPINSDVVTRFIEKTMEKQTPSINVLINSPGGSISDGNKIIEQIETLKHQGYEVNCIADFAASMAFIILQACPNRYALSTSVLMQHQMSLGISGEINRIESYLHYIKTLRKNIDIMQSRRLGLTVNEFQDRVKDEWWIYGDENKKLNIVDDIVLVKCTNNLNKFKDQVAIETALGDVLIKFKGCPLIRKPIQIEWMNIKKDVAIKIATNYLKNPEKFINTNYYKQVT